MRTLKPFLCYLKDAELPPRRFVSSFAKRIKAPKKKGKKQTVWQFIVEGAKLISAADTWVQISEIAFFFFPLFQRGANVWKEKACLRIRRARVLSVGEKKRILL